MKNTTANKKNLCICGKPAVNSGYAGWCQECAGYVKNYQCPVCGGDLIGDGYTCPVHCENADSPDDAEPDSGPYYCDPKE